MTLTMTPSKSALALRACPIYIFDLDGTLADIEHRVPILKEDSSDKWSRFYRKCVDDQPIRPVVQLLESLRQSPADIRIWTGRSDAVRIQTIDWLAMHTSIHPLELRDMLKMRVDSDHRPDYQLKLEWLNEMPARERGRIVGVFEDRDQVVQMWRENAVQCFQVAPGAF